MPVTKSSRLDGSRPGPSQPAAASAATDPLDDGSLNLAPIGAVTALLVVGRGETIQLLSTQRNFSLGSSPSGVVDVSVSSRRGTHDPSREKVSKLHVVMQRRGRGLWVVDQTSTNGTFVNDCRATEFQVEAGQAFRVANVTLFALDDHVTALREPLARGVGLHAHDLIDAAMIAATEPAPLLLLGARGCEQRAIAEAIHRASPRRRHAFVAVQPPLATLAEQAAVLRHASHGTAFLDLATIEAPSAPFVTELFGRTYSVRPVVASPDVTTAARRLGEGRLPTMRVIQLRPLGDRPADVPLLFDAHFRRAQSGRSITELGPANVAALAAQDWPGNLDDLKRAAPRLLALLDHHSDVTAAAVSLGITRQALAKWLGRLGLSL